MRETITVLETVAADEYVLPPMIIYKGKAHYRGWNQNLPAQDVSTVFALSNRGWTNQILGVEYLKLLFEPNTYYRVAPHEYRLLIVNGHNSHFSWEF